MPEPLTREQIAEINPAAIGEMLGRRLIESHELLRAALDRVCKALAYSSAAAFAAQKIGAKRLEDLQKRAADTEAQ